MMTSDMKGEPPQLRTSREDVPIYTRLNDAEAAIEESEHLISRLIDEVNGLRSRLGVERMDLPDRPTRERVRGCSDDNR